MSRTKGSRNRVKKPPGSNKRSGDQRLCLKCSVPFTSAGPGNRLCSRCNQENVTESACHAYKVPPA